MTIITTNLEVNVMLKTHRLFLFSTCVFIMLITTLSTNAQNRKCLIIDEVKVSNFLSLRGMLNNGLAEKVAIPSKAIEILHKPICTESDISAVLMEPSLSRLLKDFQSEDVAVQRIKFLDDLELSEVPTSCRIFITQLLHGSEYVYPSYPKCVFVWQGSCLTNIVANDTLVPEGIIGFVKQPVESPEWERTKRKILAWMVAHYAVELVPKSILTFIDEPSRIEPAMKYCYGQKETVCLCQLEYFRDIVQYELKIANVEETYFLLIPTTDDPCNLPSLARCSVKKSGLIVEVASLVKPGDWYTYFQLERP